MRVGLWIGIVMLVLPWICVAGFYIISLIYDSNMNRWDVDRDILAEAVLDDSTDELYDMFADDVIDRTGITQEDLEDFLDQCNIDFDKSDVELFGDMGNTDYSHYRPYTSHANGRNQLCFQYSMFQLNSDDGKLFIAGVDGDSKGEDYIGIYYISYQDDNTSFEIGEKAPREH